MAAYTISMTLGGIKMPRVPVEVMVPAASSTEYLARSIGGRAKTPIMVTPAPTMPLAIPNTVPTIIVVRAMAPGSGPKSSR